MDDLRWFAPNRFCTLPVQALRGAGLKVALEGDAAARLAVAADGVCAVEAFRYTQRHRCPLLLYLWDLPPWHLGRGRPDWVVMLGSRLQKIPRLVGGYPGRPGYYSRLRFLAHRAVEVWCPSANTVHDVQAHFAIDSRRMPFCYDSDRFHGADQPRNLADGTPPILLSISRLVPHKNHAAMLHAAARLTPRPQVHLIGRGPEAEPLRRLAAQLGIVLRLDDAWATDEEVVAAYRAAAVVVCPSRFEGFGLTPIEGLAMGIPVVASDIPPHREFVGAHVRLFPPDDDNALARELEQALRRHAADPSRSGQGGVAAVHDLTIAACAARFLPQLERLLRMVG